MIATRKAVLLVFTVLLGTTAWGQEFPRQEVSADYSYAHYVPSTVFSNVKNQGLNGGGGAYVFNLTQYLGIKADFQGYGSFSSTYAIPVSTNFPDGGILRAQGNLFTYLFGPTVKLRTHMVQPFGNLLVGGAHSNLYGTAYKQCGVSIVCSFNHAPSGNGFAFAIGGGVDIPLGKYIQFRPGEIDYLLTNFSNPFNHGSQNNFRYLAGVNFTLGGTGKTKTK